MAFCGHLGKSVPFVLENRGQFVNLEWAISVDECPFLNRGQYKGCDHGIFCSVHNQ